MGSKPIVLGIAPIVGEQSWKKLGEWADLKVRERHDITLESSAEPARNTRYMEIQKDREKISSRNSTPDILVTYLPSTEEMKA